MPRIGAPLPQILMLLPARDFDPTEAAVTWQVLTALGHIVRFATPDGRPAAADDIMVTGQGMDLWGFIPGLRRLVGAGRLLRANADARAAYAAMLADRCYHAPVTWAACSLTGVDGLVLPGGHRARGMRAYIDSPALQSLVVAAFAGNVPVAAICHGVLLAARSINPVTGKSVLYGRRTTALTWALEKAGWQAGRVLRFWDPSYYRTYSETAGQAAGFMSVQQEVTRALQSPDDFCDVAVNDPNRGAKTGGLNRDSWSNDTAAFVVVDGNYVSARWPGDTHSFARAFAKVLDSNK